jgi:hypothetical protein
MTAVLDRPATVDFRGVIHGVWGTEIGHRVSVTREHIAGAIPCSPTGCPIARAIGPGYKIRSTVIRRESDDSVYAALPLAARDFVEAFDNGLPVEPIEFTLKV